MLLIWGSKLYGKVDEVPGLFHVATCFGHLWYVPLIPFGSHLYIRQGTGFIGVPIGMSLKSLLVAWGRAGCLTGAVAACVVTLVMAGERNASWWVPAILAVFFGTAASVLVFARVFRRASYLRAVELSEKVGFSDAGKVLMEIHFGKMSQEEAAELIELPLQVEAKAILQMSTEHPGTAS